MNYEKSQQILMEIKKAVCKRCEMYDYGGGCLQGNDTATCELCKEPAEIAFEQISILLDD